MMEQHYLDDTLLQLRKLKTQAERAAAQLDDEEFFRAPGPGSNSVALITKHLAGNMRSRWTDFLTSDGEKPGRRRDEEFRAGGEDRRALTRAWDDGWSRLFGALESLGAGDLLARVTIRGEPHTVVEALNRQLAHYAYHVGQLVFLAKQLRGGGWQSLSVPPGASESFNEEMRERHREF